MLHACRHTLVPPVLPSESPYPQYTPSSPSLFSREPPPTAVLVEEQPPPRQAVGSGRPAAAAAAAAAAYQVPAFAPLTSRTQLNPISQQVLPLRCAPPFRSA